MKATCLKIFLVLLLSIPVLGCSAQTADSVTIIKVLEKESSTWRAADFAGHASCWYIQPYSQILISTADGSFINVPPAAMVSPSTKMGNGGSSYNTNYKLSIHGNTAWVTHHEVSLAPDGKKSFSVEIRLLEKIKGNWKLVGQSIHQYMPK